jgi:uncharacterized membrane protein YhaH (DUF805 family)
MRTLRLARVAAEAEALRLHARAERVAFRIAMALVGMIFLAGALVCLHVAAWYWLRLSAGWGQPGTAAAMAAADLVIAIVLGVIAARSRPSRVEQEALAVRQHAMEGILGAFALPALLLPTLRVVIGLLRDRSARRRQR